MKVNNLTEVVALCKRRGIIYKTSEIYGGLQNAYDYGPVGVELMRNLKNLWWQKFVRDREDMVGLDSQIILRPETWKASGHVGSFTDPLVEDKVTHKRYRADLLIENWLMQNPKIEKVEVAEMTLEEMTKFMAKHGVKSMDGNEITEPKAFNLLFETALGTVSGEKEKIYLRGETAQGIFTNFKQILDSTRMRLPFGVAQIGKSFRNEITQGQFVFRTFEFEQAEIEYFFDPITNNWHELMELWKQAMWNFVTIDLEIDPNKLRWRRHGDKERCFYSLDTYDLEYEFPFGFKEVWGIAYRTDYDLSQHINYSHQKLEWTNPVTLEKLVPHVIEPALGINRLLLMILCDRLETKESNGRVVLKLPVKIAGSVVAVFPLLKNKPELVTKAREVWHLLKPVMAVTWDDRGNIGKRYYFQDEIGTPFCVTIDFDTLVDNTVTVRFRDEGNQERVKIEQLTGYLVNKLGN